MSDQSGFLDGIQVASPCRQAWANMAGDDRVRFCGACRLNVYDLSAMSREEAETLVREREGRLCVRFFRRQDGTVLTRDCPAAFRRAARWTAGVAAGIVGLCGAMVFGGPDRSWLRRFLRGGDRLVPPFGQVQGAICEPSSPATARVSGVVRGPAGPVEGVLVSLDGDSYDVGARSTQSVELRDGRFEPSRLAWSGQRVVVHHRDPIASRLRFSGRKGLEVHDLRPGQRLDLDLFPVSADSIVEVCDPEGASLRIHRVSSPYFAWTRPDGSFELPLAPPGRYEVEVWSPEAESVRQLISVPDGATLSLELEAPR